jgi:hypothetical protein
MKLVLYYGDRHASILEALKEVLSPLPQYSTSNHLPGQNGSIATNRRSHVIGKEILREPGTFSSADMH